MREKSRHVEADAAGADDGHALARLARARQQLGIGDDLRMIDARECRARAPRRRSRSRSHRTRRWRALRASAAVFSASVTPVSSMRRAK